MPFGAFYYQSGDWERPFPIDQAHHQGNTLMPNFAAIDHKNQLSVGSQVLEQFLNKWQVINAIIDPFVLDPSAKLFDAAICLRLNRNFPRNRR
jgi:hypothetical protein